MDDPLDLKAAATVGMSNLGKLLAGHFAWRPSIYYVSACRGGGQKVYLLIFSTKFILNYIGRKGGRVKIP
jgi:hypothetical protein